MASVSELVTTTKQPYRGFIHPNEFKKIVYDDEKYLHPLENINDGIMGLTVEYMTRFLTGTPKEKVFCFSLQGAKAAQETIKFGNIFKRAKQYLDGIEGLDNCSIINAIKLVTFDVWYVNYSVAYKMRLTDGVEPNIHTINNIKIMLKRSLDFWKIYGPVIESGVTFPKISFTNILTGGVCDFLTKDTIWDFKTSKHQLNSKWTYQIFLYYILATKSNIEKFDNIKNVGIFNPRLNEVYLLETKNISEFVYEIVTHDNLGYEYIENGI